MTLRKKAPLILVLSLSGLFICLNIALRVFLSKSYGRLEQREMTINLQRAADALYGTVKQLAVTAADYSVWDETYAFAMDKNPDYIKRNLSEDVSENLKVNIVLIVNETAEFLGGTSYDLVKNVPGPIPEAIKTYVSGNRTLVNHPNEKSRIKGLVFLPGFPPMLVGASAIVTSDLKGPVRGSFIVGRYLDSLEIANLSDITHLSLSCKQLPLEDGRVPGTTSSDSFFISTLSQDSLQGSVLVRDINNHPALLLIVKMKRDIYLQGIKNLTLFSSLLAFIGVFFTLLTLLLFEGLILRRLSLLTSSVGRIGTNKDFSKHVVISGRDELATLATTINSTLEALTQADTALRESEEKFRLAFESSRDAIVWVNPDSGALVNCNHATERLLERDRGEIISTSQACLFNPEKAAACATLFIDLAQGDKGFEIETEVFTKSAEVRNVIATAAYINIHGERLIQGAFRDITEKIQAEAEKKQLQEQLIQAQKMEVIGQLAGGVAHDFNNMLAGISGFAELIQRKFGAGNPVLDRYAATIFDTAKGAAELTAKLLAYARKGKYEMALVNINTGVRDILRILEHTVDKKIIITQSLRAHPDTVVGDRGQLQNAIMNLAMNAVDAMPKGGELTFASEVVTLGAAYLKTHPYKISAGTYVMLSITDTGMGMDEKVKAKLFEPFFTTKGPGKGTGLGLASVYGTVKNHNGSIEVYTELGKGTSFKIYLPLSKASDEAHALDTAPVHMGHGTILIVDDERLIRDMAAEILKEIGYTVLTAADGQAAVEFYRDHFKEIDLIILDLIMPKMGGVDCFFELKKINPGVRAIIASGYSANGDAQKMLSNGAKGFIQKPFDIPRLSKLIQDALQNKIEAIDR
ncbi:MAG: CHASE4 domain-containing protein [Fibrobacterota bacterium]